MKRLLLALSFAALPTVCLRSASAAQTPPPRRRPLTPPRGGLPRTPTYSTVEGQPIDARLPEKKVDTRQFPEQTRAPYHHATDFKMTVLTDQLARHLGQRACCPDGNLLVTERLPGAFRIVGKDGAVGAAGGAGGPARFHAHDRAAGCGAGSGFRRQPHASSSPTSNISTRSSTTPPSRAPCWMKTRAPSAM